MLLIRFLIITVLVLYIIRNIARIILPMLFNSVINKAQQQQNPQENNRPKPEAHIKVDYIPNAKKNNIPDSEGDFIDYEEIK